jgi:hypothetical protein
MCGCMGGQVCGYHFTEIERLYRELLNLEPCEQELSTGEWDRLRQVRGALHREGLRAEVVIHQIKVREWEEANA